MLTAVVGEGAGGGVPLPQGGSGGPDPDFCYLNALWCNLRHFSPNTRVLNNQFPTKDK